MKLPFLTLTNVKDVFTGLVLGLSLGKYEQTGGRYKYARIGLHLEALHLTRKGLELFSVFQIRSLNNSIQLKTTFFTTCAASRKVFGAKQGFLGDQSGGTMVGHFVWSWVKGPWSQVY